MKATCAKIYAALNNILPDIGEILSTTNEPYTYLGHRKLGVKKIDNLGPHPILIITRYNISNEGIEGESTVTVCIDTENKTAHSIPKLNRGTHGDYKRDPKPRSQKEQREHNTSSLAWLEKINTSNCQ